MTDATPALQSSDQPAETCSPDQSRCRRSHLAPLLLLLIFLAIIYANSFSGAWVFDDRPNIVDNSNVHLESLDWESLKDTFKGRKQEGLFRPLANLSLGLNYFFHGLDTWGYHLVNLIIHCLGAVFLYLFVFKVLHLPLLRDKYAHRAGSIALLAAVLWATSPIQVTAVTYIVQRMASMAAMFFIMSMYFYLLGRTSQLPGRKIAWFAVCALCGLLALASKENAAMLPPSIFLLDILLIQGVDKGRLKRQLLPAGAVLLFLAGMAFVFTDPLNILSGYENREFTALERLLTQPRILISYLTLILYPVTDRFALIHEVQLSTSLFSPWTTMPAILFWLGWTGLGVFLARRQPLVAFCLLFFILNHLLEGSIIPLELIYEHRNYLPSMALFMLLSTAVLFFLWDFCKKRLLYVLTSLVVLISLFGQGNTVIHRNQLFEHPLYLWTDNAEKAPGLSRVHTNLGLAYSNLGLQEKAEEAYQASLQADRWHRHDLKAVPLNNLGNIRLREEEPEQALEMYQKALDVEPGYGPARPGIAQALLNLGEIEQAQEMLGSLLEREPGNTRHLTLYSLALFRQGEYEAALQEASQVLGAESKPGLAYKVLAESSARLDKQEQALDYWLQYAQAHSGDVEAWLAVARQANILGKEKILRKAAGRILDIKKGRSWQELLQGLKPGTGPEGQLLAQDPGALLGIVQKALETEIEELEAESLSTQIV
ncbi:MAG: tetratricopeptide repeat protein, partial [Desulfohalobiaceae bacterium]